MNMKTIIPSTELTARFIKGLQNYNVTYDEIKNGKWKYCGGNKDEHFNYFKLVFPNYDIPPYTNECICEHNIIENCYITNGEEILILGNCCIKKFISKSSRTCELCQKPHKNRIVNRCNDCRKGLCDNCGKTCNEKYKKCYDCAFK